MTEQNVERGPVQPIQVECPVCPVGPGQKCTVPTDNSRRPVEWFHSYRESLAYELTSQRLKSIREETGFPSVEERLSNIDPKPWRRWSPEHGHERFDDRADEDLWRSPALIWDPRPEFAKRLSEQ